MEDLTQIKVDVATIKERQAAFAESHRVLQDNISTLTKAVLDTNKLVTINSVNIARALSLYEYTTAKVASVPNQVLNGSIVGGVIAIALILAQVVIKLV